MNKNAPTLESERLKLTPLDLSNCTKEYVAWMNDNDVTRFLESGGDYTFEKLWEFLEQVEKDEILFWAINIKENNRHIGNIKIDPINLKNYYAEYGIMMGDKSEWGKGYAKEASLLVFEYCFSTCVNLRKINLGVQSRNISAVELYKKIGFIEEGRYIKHVITLDGYDDVLRMAIFNPNFQ